MADDNRRSKRRPRKQAAAGRQRRPVDQTRRRQPLPDRESEGPLPGSEPAASPAPENTSWDPVATWYTGWVGTGGSIYHRRSGLPTVMRLARLQQGESLVDIGCGHGVLARSALKAGGLYTGVDYSPRLIQAARDANPRTARFLHGDARRLLELPGLEAGSQDVAVFMLSIQDMDPLSEVLEQATTLVRPGGRLVIFMLHPAFRVPRGSGWGVDDNRKLRYRRVDHYLNELAVPMKAFSEAGNAGRRGSTWSFHRPLTAYFEGIFRGGMTVDAFEELPDSLEKQSSSIPMFVALRAAKAAA